MPVLKKVTVTLVKEKSWHEKKDGHRAERRGVRETLLSRKVNKVLRACQAVKGEIILMRFERNVFYTAVIVGCLVMLPVVCFVMIALWPDRVLVSWLIVGLGVLVVLVKLALWVIRTGTIAKVRLEEEKLRTGRLYANERLIEDEGPYSDGWSAPRQRAVMDEPYTQRPYEYDPQRQVPVPDEMNYVSYNGLRPLHIESYDWDEKQ